MWQGRERKGEEGWETARNVWGVVNCGLFQVLNNPFEDIIPRQIKRVKKDKDDEKKIKSKSKATKWVGGKTDVQNYQFQILQHECVLVSDLIAGTYLPVLGLTARVVP